MPTKGSDLHCLAARVPTVNPNNNTIASHSLILTNLKQKEC